MKRGFGSPHYDKSKLKDICAKGGRSAHEKGVAHEWTTETAKAAGRKGGLNRHAKKGGA